MIEESYRDLFLETNHVLADIANELNCLRGTLIGLAAAFSHLLSSDDETKSIGHGIILDIGREHQAEKRREPC